MRIVARALIVTPAVVGFVGSTLAADMTGDEIKAFVSGKTGYLETTTDSSTGKAEALNCGGKLTKPCKSPLADGQRKNAD
jgi:hypothetical protein